MPKARAITTEEKIALLNEYNRRRGEKDAQFFIENFVHVEDKDGPNLVIPFKLWPGQVDALHMIEANKLNIILKARQLGFSWLAVSYALHGMIYKSGYSVLALSETDIKAKELVRRVAFILRYMPELVIKHRGDPGASLLEWDSTASQVTVYRKDGEDSTFQSFPASENAGRGFTGNLVILDEWAFQQFDREIWAALFPTINRPDGGQLIGLSTIKRGSLFEETWLKSESGENDFARIFLPWTTDPRRDAKWYESVKRNFSGDVHAEYPATVEEAFSIPGGSFFSEFAEHIHVKPKEPIPKYAQRFVSLDYGLDMTAAYWYWIDRRGRARIYREIAEGTDFGPGHSGWIASDAAEKIKEAQGYGTDHEEHITAYLVPPDLIHQRRNDTGKTISDIFAKHGIYLTETSNRHTSGWVCVKELLKPIKEQDEQTGEEINTAILTIDEGVAPNLKASFLNVQRNKNNPNDIEGKGVAHKLTHFVDSLRCFAVYWITPSGEPTEERRAKWSSDMYEDYYNCRTQEGRDYLLGKWGNPFV